MKKRILSLLMTFLLLLTACAKAPTWQEQYDLGLRYLSEGSYQEAVIAFAAAIAIDEKRPEAFVGRGDAYVALAATVDDPAENLGLAAADYQTAFALDDTNADVYARLADVYIQQGEVDKARDILQQGLDKTGDADLQQRLDELDRPTIQENSDWSTTSDGQGSVTQTDVVAFTDWEGYRIFENLTIEEQQLIETAAAATIAGDVDVLRNLATSNPIEIDLTYTMWNDHKICIYKIPYSAEDDIVHEDGTMTLGSNRISVEVHPENGIGYCCSYQNFPGSCDEVGEVYEDFRLASCPCADWQWEGTLTKTNITYSFTPEKIDETTYNEAIEITFTETTKGTMQAGVCHGIFTTELRRVETHSIASERNSDETTYYEEVYQNGVWVDYKEYRDGELTYEMDEETRQEYADVIWSVNYGGSGDEGIFW